MNVNELWFKYDDNRNPIYYIDEECKHLYTGHAEEYFKNGKKYWEADVVDGIVDGVYKEYTEDEDNVLEVIEYEKYSLGKGLELLIIKIAKMKGGKLKFVTQFFYIFV